jgi:hypothetical protein
MIACGFVLGSTLTLTALALSHFERCEIGNLAEWTTGIATAGLIAMAAYQLRQQTIQQRQWATLQACDRYDTDPMLTTARLMLRALKEGERPEIKEYEITSQITTVFNYFDAIAIGVEQKLYVDAIAENHLKEIMFRRLAELWEADHPAVRKFQEEYFDYFPTFNKLLEKWNSTRYAATVRARAQALARLPAQEKALPQSAVSGD